jgi:hypothetical protein
MRITNSHWELIDGLEPSTRKLSTESVVTKKHISNSVAFRARKPCSHNCIHLCHIWLNREGPTRDHDNNTLDSSTHVGDCARTRFAYCQVQAVPLRLGVRWLSYNDYGVGEVVGPDKINVRVLAKDNFRARINSCFNGAQDGSSCFSVIN